MGDVVPLHPDSAEPARAAAARVAGVLLDLHSHFTALAERSDQPVPVEPDDEVVAAWANVFGTYPQPILQAAADLVIENEPRMVSGVRFGQYVQAAADYASGSEVRRADPTQCRCDQGWRRAALDPDALVPCKDCRPDAFRRHVNEWVPRARRIQARVTGYHRKPEFDPHDLVLNAKAEIRRRADG